MSVKNVICDSGDSMISRGTANCTLGRSPTFALAAIANSPEAMPLLGTLKVLVVAPVVDQVWGEASATTTTMVLQMRTTLL